jgi:cation transport ATPase
MADDLSKKPTIRTCGENGLKYLCGKDKVLFSNGVALSRGRFDQLEKTPGAVTSCLEDCLKNEPAACGYDWPYACSVGVLRRKKGTADLVANIRTERRREKQAAIVHEIKAGEQKKEAARERIFSSVFLVTVVMFIVGIGSAVMSAYHTSVFLIYGGKPVWTSVLTGTMLILFSGTAFTAARYFFREGGAAMLFGVLFLAAGLAVIAYSMFSTLTVNFDQFQWKDNERAAVSVAGSEALAAHRVQISVLEEEISNVSDEITRLRGEAEYWRSKSWAKYDDAAQQLTRLTEYQHTLQGKRMELISETPRLVEVEAVSQETIYSFLAGLFQVEEDVMRFFVYVLPACLYDILAPFALSVVLLLTDKNRRTAGRA